MFRLANTRVICRLTGLYGARSHPSHVIRMRQTVTGRQSLHTEAFTERKRGVPAGIILSLIPLALAAAWYAYTYNTFPPSSRRYVRRATMKHYYTNDPQGAVVEYLRAVEECKKAGLADHSNEITGLLLRLAELYDERLESPREAVTVYSSVLGLLYEDLSKDAGSAGTEHNRKMVGIAQKLGDIYARSGDDQQRLKLAERYYEWGIQRMLGFKNPPPLIYDDDELADSRADAADEPTASSVPKLPPAPPQWVAPSDLGASVEALAAVYRKQGKSILSLSVYMRALGALQNDFTVQGPARFCRQAILENNIAECYLDLAPINEKYANEARTWAGRSLTHAQQAGPETCGDCLICAKCNLGEVARALKDFGRARECFTECRKMATDAGYSDGVQAANRGLEALKG
ncbi:uncharacterized protein EV422DRAFT_537716 [Fimicolochytrium jonesii]|uniref:uncharacterized protein n=1 Tax=Fimicolochytrium jonesii TaxID=1396493 RepID=UPI0022FDB1F1|nr:uncharacterized protein EV422DRAFT_537716 [Fimicolochytrium jonesii]KAI8818626.1 hypothetical protein EV422DRAFT_537716 [Fimicolochytrium jonesii]